MRFFFSTESRMQITDPPISIPESSDMNSDLPTPNVSGAATAASKPSVSRGNCYVASAPAPDVMFDQLEYLLAHSGGDCTPDCLDCGKAPAGKELAPAALSYGLRSEGRWLRLAKAQSRAYNRSCGSRF
jgi:hypothetical protein